MPFVLLLSSFGFLQFHSPIAKTYGSPLDNKTDTNPPVNYSGKLENMIGKQIVPGQEDELRKTIGNQSLHDKPGFNASKAVDTVEKHYSQLPQIHREQPNPGGT